MCRILGADRTVSGIVAGVAVVRSTVNCYLDAYSDVDEHRMFKNAGYSVKHPLSLCSSPPSPALLLRRQATTSISIDGLRRRFLDNRSSVEKNNKRGKKKDDTGEYNTPVSIKCLLTVRWQSQTQRSRRATPVAPFTPSNIQKCFFPIPRTSLCPYRSRAPRDAWS